MIFACIDLLSYLVMRLRLTSSGDTDIHSYRSLCLCSSLCSGADRGIVIDIESDNTDILTRSAICWVVGRHSVCVSSIQVSAICGCSFNADTNMLLLSSICMRLCTSFDSLSELVVTVVSAIRLPMRLGAAEKEFAVWISNWNSVLLKKQRGLHQGC